MTEYLPRLIDSKLDEYLKLFGCVSIVGPKWVGKTRTSLEKAKSCFSFVPRKGKPDPLSLARIDSSYVFEGEKPHLIDEWQIMPEVWDMVRADIDDREEKGLYILTGSSVAPFLKKNSSIRHSGAGRIASLRMSTMTLYETGDSSGEVSLMSLFDNEPVHTKVRNITLCEIIHYIVRGGWPDNLSSSKPSIIPRAYIERLFDVELDMLDTEVNKTKFRRLMRSLSRNVSTTCTIRTLKADTAGRGTPSELDEDTIVRYLDVLSSLYLINEQEIFCPDFRTTQRFKTAVKRHYEDTSLACVMLGAGEKNLINDLEYLGFLFESLVCHDLRVYIESQDGYISHYQTYSGDEVDAVLSLSDGRFGFVEIKLGYEGVVESAAANLKRIAAKIEVKPAFLAVVSGMAAAAYTRSDGVYVLPLTTLRP